MADSAIDMPEMELEMFEDTSASQDLDVKLPYVLRNKIFLSPGVWNNYEYTADVIEKIYNSTKWSDETNSLYYDHQSHSAANWLGEVKNLRFDGSKVTGDVYIVDRDAAVKLKYGAKWGISPKIKGFCTPGTNRLYTGQFEDFSVVKTPAVKDAYLNTGDEIGNDDNVVVIINSSVSTLPESPYGHSDPNAGVGSMAKTESANVDLQSKLADWIKQHQNPTDKDLHAFAEQLKVDPSKLEEVAYEIISSIIDGGNSAGKNVKYDPAQIRKGIAVEKEHTDNLILRVKIAKDHLTENPKYYDYLDKMEKDMKTGTIKNEVDTQKMTELQKDGYPKPEEEKKDIEQKAECPAPVKEEIKDAKKEGYIGDQYVPVPKPDMAKEETSEKAEEAKAEEKEEEADGSNKPKAYPEPEMSMEELFEMFSNSSFMDFRKSYTEKHPGASMADVVKAYKAGKELAELEQTMNKKIQELSAKVEELSKPVERSSAKAVESTPASVEPSKLELAAKDVDVADELMAEFLTKAEKGEVKI